MLAAHFCQSPLIKGRVYFLKTMNVTLLAACALLVQSGALLVFFNFFAIVQ
jgi:hypothetical protein